MWRFGEARSLMSHVSEFLEALPQRRSSLNEAKSFRSAGRKAVEGNRTPKPGGLTTPRLREFVECVLKLRCSWKTADVLPFLRADRRMIQPAERLRFPKKPCPNGRILVEVHPQADPALQN